MATFSTVEERCHYTRVNRLLIDVASDMLRHELQIHIPCTALKSSIASSLNNSVRAKANIFKAQVDRVHIVGSQVKGAKCVFHTFEKIEFKGFNRQLKFRKCI